MELLATQELGREAEQTTDKGGGSQETEREGRTMELGRGTGGGSLITSIQITSICDLYIFTCC